MTALGDAFQDALAEHLARWDEAAFGQFQIVTWPSGRCAVTSTGSQTHGQPTLRVVADSLEEAFRELARRQQRARRA